MLEIKMESKMSTEKIENEVLAGEEITDEKIKNSLNYEALPEEEKKAIDEFCLKIDLENLKYAEEVQKKLLKFSDNVIKSIDAQNAEKAESLLKDLVTKIKEFDNVVPDSLNPKGIAKLFFNSSKQTEKVISKFSEIEANITKIEKQLETQKIKILKEVTSIDSIYKNAIENLKEISLYIISGEKKIENLNEETNNFENRISELKNVRINLINLLPEIKGTQGSDSRLADKIQETLRNSIPLWRNQALIALGVSNNEIENDINVEALKKNNQDILEILNKLFEEN